MNQKEMEELLVEMRAQQENDFLETQNDLYRSTLEGMIPMLQFAPEIVKNCYPSLWCMCN